MKNDLEAVFSASIELKSLRSATEFSHSGKNKLINMMRFYAGYNFVTCADGKQIR